MSFCTGSIVKRGAVCLLLLAADCGDDGGTSEEGTETGTTGDDSTSAPVTVTDTGPTTDANDTSSSTAPTGETSESTSVDSGEASSTSGGGGVCEPSGDNVCSLCVQDSCCADYLACQDNEFCECHLACRVEGGGENNCANGCMANPPANPAIMAIEACLVGACSDAC